MAQSQHGKAFIFNSLRPRPSGRHFPDDIFKWIFVNENVWILIKISLKFVSKGLINHIPALVQIMAWRQPGDKPLSEPMMVSLLTYICVTRPQWVNNADCSLTLYMQNEKTLFHFWTKFSYNYHLGVLAILAKSAKSKQKWVRKIFKATYWLWKIPSTFKLMLEVKWNKILTRLDFCKFDCWPSDLIPCKSLGHRIFKTVTFTHRRFIFLFFVYPPPPPPPPITMASPHGRFYNTARNLMGFHQHDTYPYIEPIPKVLWQYKKVI